MKVSVESIANQYRHPHQTLQPNIIAATTVLLVIAYVAVLLRGYARHRSQLKYGADDVLIVLALLFTTGFATGIYLCVKYGLGRHAIFLGKHEESFAITYLINVAMYAIANVLTKASVLCFYHRMFNSKRLKQLSWFLGAIIVAYDVGIILVAFLACIPIENWWTLNWAHCIDTRPPMTVLGIVNIIMDFVILAIPIRFVVRLHMNVWLKIQVCGIFLTGIITCVFGIVRVVEYANAAQDDISYDLVWPAVWAFCEVAIGILAACLPTMGIYFTKPRHPPSFAFSARTISQTIWRKSSVFKKSVAVRKDSVWSRKSWWSTKKSPQPSKSRITLLRSPEPEEEKGWPLPMDGSWPTPVPAYSSQPPTVITTPEMVQQAPEPEYILNIEIPSHRLHRWSGNTDIITRFAPTMSRWYNRRWSRLEDDQV